MKRILLVVAALSAIPVRVPADDLEGMRRRILSLGVLTNAPAMASAEGVPDQGGARAVFFDALPWKGIPTRVFAWLGLPPAREGRAPGIVLVHGGGGTAYVDWVRKWNEHGFAAISIALEGQTDEHDPASEGKKRAWKRHVRAGPVRAGIYDDSGAPIEDQWMYHAVAATVLAHSLLRSFPEVDADKVGLSGISWGGVVTSTVMGIDPRFAFSIPIYGCGSMHNADNQWGRALEPNAVYRQAWDPVLRKDRARMPALWLSWPEENHFPLDCQAASYRAMAGPRMVALIPRMGHSHPAGWAPPDSYAFADSVVRTGRPWCSQIDARAGDDAVYAIFESSKPIDTAVLIHTADLGFTGDRQWNETPAVVSTTKPGVWRADAELPSGSTAWFINFRSGHLTASSEYYETDRAIPLPVGSR